MAQAPAIDNDHRVRNYARIVAKAWHDPAFKQRLKEDPSTVLREENHPGVEGKTIHVVEEDPGTKYFVIPKKPAGASSFDEYHERAREHADFGVCCCI